MLWCQGAQNIGLSNRKLKSALKYTVRVIIMHAPPRQTDGQTNGRTDEHHGTQSTDLRQGLPHMLICRRYSHTGTSCVAFLTALNAGVHILVNSTHSLRDGHHRSFNLSENASVEPATTNHKQRWRHLANAMKKYSIAYGNV